MFKPSDELSLGPRKGLQKLGAIQKTSGVGTLVKSQSRQVCAAEWRLPAVGGRWPGALRRPSSRSLCCLSPVEVNSLLSPAGLWVCDLSFQETRRPNRDFGIASLALGGHRRDSGRSVTWNLRALCANDLFWAGGQVRSTF